MSKWAPHTCVGRHSDGDPCGSPAYIGFGVPPKCTQRGCPYYDKRTAVAHAIEVERELEAGKTPVLKSAKTGSIKDVISIKINGKDGKDIKPVGGFGTPFVFKSIEYSDLSAPKVTYKDDLSRVDAQDLDTLAATYGLLRKLGEQHNELRARIRECLPERPVAFGGPLKGPDPSLTDEEQEVLDHLKAELKRRIEGKLKL